METTSPGRRPVLTAKSAASARVFFFDEPESALSSARQIEFSKLMRPLLRLTKYGLEPVSVEETDHHKVMREFCDDLAGFVEAAMGE